MYLACPGLQIRKQVSCPKGISALPNYINRQERNQCRHFENSRCCIPQRQARI